MTVETTGEKVYSGPWKGSQLTAPALAAVEKKWQAGELHPDAGRLRIKDTDVARVGAAPVADRCAVLVAVAPDRGAATSLHHSEQQRHDAGRGAQGGGRTEGRHRQGHRSDRRRSAPPRQPSWRRLLPRPRSRPCRRWPDCWTPSSAPSPGPSTKDRGRSVAETIEAEYRRISTGRRPI